MKKILYLIFAFLLFTACGSKSKSNSSELEDDPSELIEIEKRAYKDGHAYGSDDASDGKPYLTSCHTKSGYDFWGTKKQSQAWAKGFRRGYDDGYNEGKAAHNSEINNGQELEEYEINNVTVTTSNTPNTYSTPNVSNSTLHSDEKIYGDFYNYKETNDCVEGVVVYEGRGGYYIVETKQGYTILEDYSGTLFEDAMIRGELNQYNNKYIINRNKNQEIKVYIEDYMLSDRKAVEWMGKNNHLKSDDQGAYDANNQ